MTDTHDTVTAELPAPAAGPAMRMLEVSSIEASPTNPRKHFDQVKLKELADSIRASGVHQPVLVRPLPGSRVPATFGARRPSQPLPAYELVAGERRLRACRLAGVAEIPAMIRELRDDQVLEIQIVENLQRDDLTEMEEAEGYEHLMEHTGMTVDQVGAKIGKSRSYVYARLKLTMLCMEVRTSLREGQIDASKALLAARLPDHKLQLRALEVLTRKAYDGEPISYRDAARIIQREFMLNLDAACFQITDITLVPAAGSCRACVKRTGHEPDLFADVKNADVCTDPACYRTKEQAHTDRQMKQAHERGQTVIEGREAKALMQHSYTNEVEGYRRLDDVRDSPTDKPLRKLIGKAMEKAGILPTLVANPHKAGELVAVLLPEQVTQLLKVQGHDDAATRIASQAQSAEKAKERQASEDEKRDYETTWRWNVLETAWQDLNKAGGPAVQLPAPVTRHVAMSYARMLNTDNAKRLCKLLDLGKVAPKEGITQWVADIEHPSRALQLLVMFQDVEYRHWLPNGEANKGLMLVAEECKVDIEAAKARAKANQRAKKAEKPQKPLAANEPAAPLREGAGGKAEATKAKSGGKKTARPAAPAAPAKTSATEASLAIAAAMQGLEDSTPGAAAASQDSAGPVVGGAGALGVGVRVKVLANVQSRLTKWIGKTGTVKASVGPEAWDVTFAGKAGGLAGFHVSELELLA